MLIYSNLGYLGNCITGRELCYSLNGDEKYETTLLTVCSSYFHTILPAQLGQHGQCRTSFSMVSNELLEML